MKRFVVVFILVAAGLWVAYSAFIYYDNNFRYGRMRETPVVKPHEDPIPTMDKDAVPIHGGEALLRIGEGEELSSPLTYNAPETLAAGKKAYFNFCVPCHGKNLDFHTISFGKERMRGLATTIAVENRWAVIHYVRSWTASVKEPK
jgi:hypothetical protein